jgi:hypothetical protein
MTPTDLLNAALGFHGAAFVGAATAYYKYGDRSELFSKSLAGTEAALVQMRSHIADELGRVLAPLFASPGTDPYPILDPTGSRYVERPLNPVGSEAYKEAVRDFCETYSVVIVHYRTLHRSCERWLAWARTISWTILLLTVWELVACAIGGLLKLDDWPPSFSVVAASFFPTAVFAACLIVQLFALQYHHDGIMDIRGRYNAP